MAVSKRLRYEILRRDNNTCRYCGGSAPDVTLTIDHVVPVSLGGSDDPSNLVAACRDCNAGKTSSSPDAPLVADVDRRALMWAEALRIVAQGRVMEREERRKLEEFLESHWNYSHSFQRETLPYDWFDSIQQFIKAGLDVEDLTELMSVALDMRTVTRKWRYFCGCCWTRIREDREQAQRIVVGWEAEA